MINCIRLSFLFVFSLAPSILIAAATIINQEQVVLGPKIFKAQSSQNKKYNFDFAAHVDQYTTYKIKILNADGLDHNQVKCEPKKINNLFQCLYQNFYNQLYVLFFRAHDVNIKINGILKPQLHLNEHQSQIISQVSLKELNKIELSVVGFSTAYIQLSIIETSTKDTIPPVLSQLKPDPTLTTHIRSLVVPVSGVSNEKLSLVTIETQAANISTDGLSFNAQATFTQYGAQNIHIIAKDLSGNTTTQIIPVNLIANQQPIASISLSAANYVAPTTVSFSGVASYDLDGTITSYNWDFGDGTTSIGVLANHAYEKPGNYKIILTITDNEGATNKIESNIVVVANQLPIAKLSVDKVQGNLPLTINFDASQSKDQDGVIVSYIWNFSDGETLTTTNPTAAHTYQINGHFSALLTVVDDKGGTSITSIDLKVNAIPVASFSQNNNGLSYAFDASSSTDADDDRLTYQWDFGDGSTADGKISQHNYSSYGEYTVVLKVSDQLATVQSSVQINIIDPSTNTDSDESEELESSGYLTILNGVDQTFNPVGGSVTLELKNAHFLSKEQTSVKVNDEFISRDQINISGQILTINNFLVSGLNKIEIESQDTDQLTIMSSFQIWAGEKNVSISAIDQNGKTVNNITQISYQLASNENIKASTDQTTLQRIPNSAIVVVVKDSLNRSGVGLLNANDTSITVQLWENDLASIETEPNPNFINGIGGFKITADSYSLANDAATSENYIQASSKSNMRLAKVVKLQPDTKTVQYEFSLKSTDPNATYVAVLKDLSTGEIQIKNDVLSNFGAPTPNIVTNQIATASKLSAKTLSVAAAKASANAQSQGTRYVSFNRFNLFSNLVLELYVVSNSKVIDTLTEAQFKQIQESNLCIENVQIFDWVPTPEVVDIVKGQFSQSMRTKPDLIREELPIKFLSIGKIPDTYASGKNNIKLVIESCGIDFNFTAKASSLNKLLGQSKMVQDYFFPPLIKGNKVYSALINVNEIKESEDVAARTNLEVLESIVRSQPPLNRTIDLSFTVIGTNNSGKEEKVYFSKQVGYLIRNDYLGRQSGNRDDNTTHQKKTGLIVDQGGDDWSQIWFPGIVLTIMNKFPDLKINDISNMNGTYSPDHFEHVSGNMADFYIGNLFDGTTQKDPVEKIELVKRLELLFKDKYNLSHISKSYLNYNIPLDGMKPSEFDLKPELNKLNFKNDYITWNRFRHLCLPDGRYAKSVLTSDFYKAKPAHGNHIHLNISEDSSSPSVDKLPDGTIDLQIAFNPKPSIVTTSYYPKLNFSQPIFDFNNPENMSYEVFIELPIKGIQSNDDIVSYNEFVPLTTDVNTGLNPGKYKLKIVKVKNNYNADATKEYDKNFFTCSQEIQYTDIPTAYRDAPEYFWIDIQADGHCGGEYLKIMRNYAQVIGDDNLPLPADFEIGFVSPKAVVQSGARLGKSTYICGTSKIESKTEVIGADDGVVELTNSTVIKGSSITGHVFVENSKIDHAMVQGPTVSSTATREEALFIGNAIITDKLDAEYGPGKTQPIYIANSVNIEGTPDAPVRIERQTASFNLLEGLGAKLFGRENAIGSYINGDLGDINILNGSLVVDSDLAFRPQQVNFSDIVIDNKSEIIRSGIFGVVDINDSAKVSYSLVQSHDTEQSITSIDEVKVKISSAVVNYSHLTMMSSAIGSNVSLYRSSMFHSQVAGESSVVTSNLIFSNVSSSSISHSSLSLASVQHSTLSNSYYVGRAGVVKSGVNFNNLYCIEGYSPSFIFSCSGIANIPVGSEIPGPSNNSP